LHNTRTGCHGRHRLLARYRGAAATEAHAAEESAVDGVVSEGVADGVVDRDGRSSASRTICAWLSALRDALRRR